MYKKLFKRRISFLMIMMMTFSIVGFIPSEVNAAKKYELPTSTKTYSNANQWKSDSPKWANGYKITYKYDKKGNVIKLDRATAKWTYKKGKPVKVKSNAKTIKLTAVSTYKKGKLKESTLKYPGGSYKLKYSYKNGWLSKCSGKLHKKYKLVGTYTWKKHSNGMPKSLVIKNKYIGTTIKVTGKFDKKGLLTSTNDTIDGDIINKYKYEYKYDSKGRVVERIVYDMYDNTPVARTVYSYGKATTSNKKVYLAIVNSDTPATLFDDAFRDVIPHNTYFGK